MRKVSLKNVTIIELLVTLNQRYADIPALQIKEGDKFRSISYIELGRRTSDTAYNLKRLGVEKADRVTILSESRPEWAIAFFGIVSCGGITVPLDIKLSDAEIEFILNDSGAKCIFVSQKLLETVFRIKPKLTLLQNVICLDDVTKEGILLLKDFKVPENEVAHREIQPEDTAVIVYTSGTTGVTKGVELTYKNLLFEVMALNKYIKFSPKDRFLSILPLNHMLELTGGMIAPLYTGARITYCDTLKPANMIKLMQETKATTMICVPLVLKMFHNSIIKKAEDMKPAKKKIFYFMLGFSKFLLHFNIHIGKLFFRELHKQFGGHLKCFVSGGAPLDAQVEKDFNALGFFVLQGYGLTETSPVITVNTFSECKYGSVGIPLEGVEIKIVPQAEGSKEGEILVRGPNVMRGYYKNKEKTDELLKDGWFYTGDIGYFDADGFLYISGRIKNLIVLGAGKKVFPEEVEEVMSAGAFIKEICVLGRIAQKGIRKGCEEVYAVVVPNLDSFIKEERENKEIIRKKIGSEISRLGENLAEYKRIMDFDIWYEELPKTSTRKVKRKVLLELISKKEAGEGVEKKEFIEAAEIIEDDLTLKLRKIVSDLIKIPQETIKINSNLSHELAMDSLMKVEVLAAIHKELNIDIPERLSYEINTFGDLLKFTQGYKVDRRDDDEIAIRKDSNNFIRKNIRLKLGHNAAYFIFKSLFKIYFRKSVFGLENIPSNSSFIIAANHTSLLDLPLILTSLPFKKMRDVFAPAAKDYFYAKKYRKAIVELLFNTFPFERMGDFMKGLKICEALVRNNRSIILFPEGTRVMEDKLQPFKSGLGSLALNLNVPILPVYIEGAFKALPKGKIIPLPKKIEIHFGNAIFPAQLEFSSSKTNYEKYLYLSELTFNEVSQLRTK